MKQAEENIETTYRTMLAVWAIMLSSSVLLFFVTMVLIRLNDASTSKAPALLVYGAVGAGVLTFIDSFVFARRIQKKAIETRSLKTALIGLIVPLALCEVSTLAGMITLLETRSPYFYLCFGLGVLGIIMHFPKKSTLPIES